MHIVEATATALPVTTAQVNVDNDSQSADEARYLGFTAKNAAPKAKKALAVTNKSKPKQQVHQVSDPTERQGGDPTDIEVDVSRH